MIDVKKLQLKIEQMIKDNNWFDISRQPFLTEGFMLEHINQLHIQPLVSTQDLSLPFIEKLMSMGKICYDDFYNLCLQGKITRAFVNKYHHTFGVGFWYIVGKHVKLSLNQYKKYIGKGYLRVQDIGLTFFDSPEMIDALASIGQLQWDHLWLNSRNVSKIFTPKLVEKYKSSISMIDFWNHLCKYHPEMLTDYEYIYLTDEFQQSYVDMDIITNAIYERMSESDRTRYNYTRSIIKLPPDVVRKHTKSIDFARGAYTLIEDNIDCIIPLLDLIDEDNILKYTSGNVRKRVREIYKQYGPLVK